MGRGDTIIWVDYELDSGSRRAPVHVQVREQKPDPPSASITSGTYRAPLRLELRSDKRDAEIRYNISYDGETPQTPGTTTGTLYEGPIELKGVAGQSQRVKIRAIACGRGYERSNGVTFSYTIDLADERPPDKNTVSLDPGSLYIPEEKTSLFGALPNGITYAQLTEKINVVTTANVVLTPGSEGEGVITVDPEHPMLAAPVTWETDSYDYDPEDMQEQTFTIRGRVDLPDWVNSGGRDLHVYLPVVVVRGEVAKPVAKPAPGTYRTDQKVVLTSAATGAEIYYTISGESGTKKYTGAITLKGKAGEKRSWQIRAYAMKGGVTSDTVSFAYTVNIPKVPGKTKGLRSTVKASGKKIVSKWTATGRATGYKVGWRKAGGSWKYRTVTGRSYTIKGLAAGGCYEVKVAALNEGGQGAFSSSKYCLISRTAPTLKAGKRSFTIRMKKAKGAGGYKVKYSLKSNMSSSRTKNTGKLSIKVSKLKARKTYYVQATPYKKIGGRTYMGEPVKKKVKTKK